MITGDAQIGGQANSTLDHALDQREGQTQASTQAAVEEIATQALLALPPEEEFATPETQQELTSEQIDSLIDPQLRTMVESHPPAQILGEDQQESSLYPLETVGGEFEMQNADVWLSNVFDEEDGEWMQDREDAESSPLTSVASEPDTAGGKLFRGCRCVEHQPIYDNWPTHDAELTIAKCMTVCMYCGVDYHRAPTLRSHLNKSAKHAPNNISVVRETMGRGSSDTPSWKPKPRGEMATNTRVTRRQAATNSTKVTSHR